VNRYRMILSLEVDPQALDAWRDTLEESDALDLYPGKPEEWASFTDIVSAHEEQVITRAEVLTVTDAPGPWEPPARSRRHRASRTLDQAAAYVIAVVATPLGLVLLGALLVFLAVEAIR
jgi:hypothetical protein